MMYDNCLTQIELDEFTSHPDIEVIFDIGAKDNIEYLNLRPDAIFHLFEPHPIFFEKLKARVTQGNWKNVILNNFGIGDATGTLGYSTNFESFDGSEACSKGGGALMLPIESLDSYCVKNNISKIDFIKMDTEGFEYKIIKGNPKAIAMAKYIQYEHWGNDESIRELLPEFTFKDLGNRNIFCTRNG